MYDKINELTSSHDVQLTFTGTSCIVAMKPKDEYNFGNPVLVKNASEQTIADAICNYGAIVTKAKSEDEDSNDTVGLENVKGSEKPANKSTSKRSSTAKTVTTKKEVEEKAVDAPADPAKLAGPDPDKFKLPSEQRRQMLAETTRSNTETVEKVSEAEATVNTYLDEDF